MSDSNDRSDPSAKLMKELLKQQQDGEKAARKDVADHIQGSHNRTMDAIERLTGRGRG